MKFSEARKNSKLWPRLSPIVHWWLGPRRWAIVSCNIRCARIEYGGRVLRKHLVSQPAALLFGSEKFGLSNDDLSYCQWLVRIGTEGSMNLGQAVAVCLYELTRKAVVSKPEKRKPARAEDLERLTERLTNALMLSGYVHSAGTEAKIRRLVRRLDLPAHDAEVWLGMLRQIQWKLGQRSE